MSDKRPILVTGAAGDVGFVSSILIRMLLDHGWPVRAFVRSDDARAAALRAEGAQVFVGDLLRVADVADALKGCSRVYFSMSLSPYYVDANILLAAVAKSQGDLDVVVNISEFEQTFMTFDRMTLPLEERRDWLGGIVTDWSPQQRAHWIAEQVLDWSGLPRVHIRATMFVENPLLSWYPVPTALESGELRLPFGAEKIAPIVAFDVAEVCARILVDPAPHVGRAYALTGPELKDMAGFAQDYETALERPIVYRPQQLESWNERYIDASVAARSPHTAEHLKTLTRLVAGGRYNVITDDLETLLGRPPKRIGWALQNNPRVQKALAKHRLDSSAAANR